MLSKYHHTTEKLISTRITVLKLQRITALQWEIAYLLTHHVVGCLYLNVSYIYSSILCICHSALLICSQK